MHNGGAYGDGAAESGVGFGCGAARTAGKLGQLALSSGGIGASGQDYFVERFWEDEPGNCSAARDQQGHGKSVAVPIPHIRQIADETGVSKSTVHRIWQAFGLQPHRQKQFKLSSDPFFVEKVRDIVALYLNPPENAVVLCVDEKSGIQALERTQPMLPLGLGYVEGVTHDYRRHGTTTLFAALDTANGKVLTKCRPRHRHQEYLSFLREIEKHVPKNLEVHIIVDNYATHKHLRVKRWFATRPRFHVHFTPTYASWLNQVEIWFNRITQQAIRRGTFSSVKDLVEKIDHYVQNSNRRAQPFVWTATADSIFAKVERLCERIYGTAH